MCRQSRLTAKYQSNSKDLMYGIISQTLASLTLAKADSFFELLLHVGRQMGIRWGESNVQLNIFMHRVCFVHTSSWPLTNMCGEVAANFILPLLSCAADNKALFLNFPLFSSPIYFWSHTLVVTYGIASIHAVRPSVLLPKLFLSNHSSDFFDFLHKG